MESLYGSFPTFGVPVGSNSEEWSRRRGRARVADRGGHGARARERADAGASRRGPGASRPGTGDVALPLSLQGDPLSDLPAGIHGLSDLQSGFAAQSSPVRDLARISWPPPRHRLSLSLIRHLSLRSLSDLPTGIHALFDLLPRSCWRGSSSPPPPAHRVPSQAPALSLLRPLPVRRNAEPIAGCSAGIDFFLLRLATPSGWCNHTTAAFCVQEMVATEPWRASSGPHHFHEEEPCNNNCSNNYCYCYFCCNGNTILKKLGALERNKVVRGQQRWRLITCMWLHAGLIHIIAYMTLSLEFALSGSSDFVLMVLYSVFLEQCCRSFSLTGPYTHTRFCTAARTSVCVVGATQSTSLKESPIET